MSAVPSAPSGRCGWDDVQNLVWYQEPLMIAFGTYDASYLGFASSGERNGARLYFCVAMPADGMESFMKGGIDVERAIRASGGSVFYTDDLIEFETVDIDEMPEDDRVVLRQTGLDYESIMDAPPSFLR